MTQQDLVSLFLTEPEGENAIKKEHLAGLARHAFLTELFTVTKKSKIIESLMLLQERKFEEAYCALMSVDSVQGIQDILNSARQEVDEHKEESKKPNKLNQRIKK